MSELNFLLSSYTTGEIVAILIVSLLLVVAIARACGFIWEKIKNYFQIKNDEDQWKDNLVDKIDDIGTEVKDLKVTINEIEHKAEERGERLKKVEEYAQADYKREQELFENNQRMNQMCKRVQARLQDDTRWSFKDAYNYYYVKEHKIDSNSLEALEKKYEHYKEAGGNSFVDNIMIKLRTLPIVPTMGDDINDSTA